MSEKYKQTPHATGFQYVTGGKSSFACATEYDARSACHELNALHARVQELEAENAVLTERAHDALANAVEHENKLQELEAENAKLHKRIQRVTEETARIVNDMYEKEQNDPATEIEARLFVSGMLSYADYTGDDSDANH